MNAVISNVMINVMFDIQIKSNRYNYIVKICKVLSSANFPLDIDRIVAFFFSKPIPLYANRRREIAKFFHEVINLISVRQEDVR